MNLRTETGRSTIGASPEPLAVRCCWRHLVLSACVDVGRQYCIALREL